MNSFQRWKVGRWSRAGVAVAMSTMEVGSGFDRQDEKGDGLMRKNGG